LKHTIKDFNYSNYLDLLKKNDELNREAKSLASENPDDYAKFLKYEAILESAVIYKNKIKYYNLVKKYLSKEINLGSFRYQFLKLEPEDQNCLKSLSKNKISNLSIKILN
jgi:hypothetical protein